jgi:hypothetical protein
VLATTSTSPLAALVRPSPQTTKPMPAIGADILPWMLRQLDGRSIWVRAFRPPAPQKEIGETLQPITNVERGGTRICSA